jgi:methyltransferase
MDHRLFIFIFTFLIVERLIELVLSKKNERILLHKGAQEAHHFFNKGMMILNMSWFIALAFEYIRHPQNQEALLPYILPFMIFFQVIRYWTVFLLKEQWTIKLMRIPHPFIVTKGPYRFLKHPNYLVVLGEILVIPLLFSCYKTLVVFFILNLCFFYFKIKFEEQLLGVS